MEMILFGVIIVAYLAAVALIPWHGLQAILALTWALMGLSLLWTVGKIVFRFATG